MKQQITEGKAKGTPLRLTGAAGVDAVNIAYCELWNDQLHEPKEPMSTETARALDRQGEPYTVVLGCSPIC